MINIETFIKEELDDITKIKLIQILKNSKNKKQEKIIYNRFSIDIFFKKNTIKIYDDIFTESKPYVSNIKEFIKIIK